MGKLLSKEPIKHVLTFDKDLPDEEKTTFLLRPLSFDERSAIQDEAVITEVNWAGPKNKTGAAVMKHLGGSQAKKAIEKGLVKIENLRDENGELVPYEVTMEEKYKKGVLDRLPPEWTNELAKRIMVLSGLSKDEEKN